jgi:hypothetical protein
MKNILELFIRHCHSNKIRFSADRRIMFFNCYSRIDNFRKIGMNSFQYFSCQVFQKVYRSIKLLFDNVIYFGVIYSIVEVVSTAWFRCVKCKTILYCIFSTNNPFFRKAAVIAPQLDLCKSYCTIRHTPYIYGANIDKKGRIFIFFGNIMELEICYGFKLLHLADFCYFTWLKPCIN